MNTPKPESEEVKKAREIIHKTWDMSTLDKDIPEQKLEIELIAQAISEAKASQREVDARIAETFDEWRSKDMQKALRLDRGHYEDVISDISQAIRSQHEQP